MSFNGFGPPQGSSGGGSFSGDLLGSTLTDSLGPLTIESAAAQALVLDGDQQIRLFNGSGEQLKITSTNLRVAPSTNLGWGPDMNSTDAGIKRLAAGSLAVYDPGTTQQPIFNLRNAGDTATTIRLVSSSSSVDMGSGGAVRWSGTSGDATATKDLILSRVADGRLDVAGSAAGGRIELSLSGSTQIDLNGAATPIIKVANDGYLQWSSTANAAGTTDLSVFRNAEGALALSNGNGTTNDGNLYLVSADEANGVFLSANGTAGRLRVGNTLGTSDGGVVSEYLFSGASGNAGYIQWPASTNDMRVVGDLVMYGTGNGQITWATGLGAITHLLGPSDQEFSLSAGAGQAARLASSSSDDLYLDARGANKVRISTSQTSFFTQKHVYGGSTGSSESYSSNGNVTLTESTATTVFTNLMATDTVWAGLVHINTYATDGTEDQVRSGLYQITLKNDGGTVAGTVTVIQEQAETSSGTLTQTITVNDGTGGLAQIQCNAVSSLTQTTLNAQVHIISGSFARGGTTSVGSP